MSEAQSRGCRGEEARKEIGLDITEEFPKPLTDVAVRAADAVITMGCGDACPFYLGRRSGSFRMPRMDAPLLMIPGPTPVSTDVLTALAEPVRSHAGPENAMSVRRIQARRATAGATS